MEENTRLYYPGGLHPVSIGDEFKNGRYRVVHKLGFGDSSTVWLARDTWYGEERWVALKILQARDSIPESSPSRSREALTLRALQDFLYVPAVYDEFFHRGPNGSHLCFVTELLGPSLARLFTGHSVHGTRPVDSTWLSSCLLRAIAGLHEAGISHGGLSLDNVVIRDSRLKWLSEEQLLGVIGHPQMSNTLLADQSPPGPHLPKTMVSSTQWHNWSSSFQEGICLVGFGASFRFHELPAVPMQPGNLCVPEIMFSARLHYKADLWRLGCVIYAVLFREYPFPASENEALLVASMINFVEDLPPEWGERWQMLKARLPFPPLLGSESKLLMRFKHLQEERLEPLLRVIQGLMRFRPEDRMSAHDALEILRNCVLENSVAENP